VERRQRPPRRREEQGRLVLGSGATVPPRYLTRVGAQSLRIYFTAQDPWMFTNTSVLDPEGQTGNGVPIFRTLLIGGSFGF